MITVVPYLSFRGNCEEALNTYIKAFGGEIYYLSCWSEKTFDVTPEQIGKVSPNVPDELNKHMKKMFKEMKKSLKEEIGSVKKDFLK